MKIYTMPLSRRLWADANDWTAAHPVMFTAYMALAGALVGTFIKVIT